MTDASEPGPGAPPWPVPASAPAPATTTGPPAAPAVPVGGTVLAQGHLHPAILLLRLFDAVRQAVFPLALGVLVDRLFLALAGFLFLTQLGYALARYLTLQFVLTDEELRIREGLLERQERRIPLDRIQDLGFESTLLRRALGLCVVLVETASGRGVEARLDALSRSEAEHLRAVLLAARERAPAGPATASSLAVPDQPPPPPAPVWLVHRSRAAELLLRGLTDLRLSAFAVTGFAAFQFADQLGLAARLRGAARSFEAWLAGFPPTVVALLVLLLVLAVTAFGVVASTIGNLVQFHGFELWLHGDVLQRRYGLLTTRQKTLPRARIQRVTVEQPWLRRLCGLAVVKADSAGGSRADGEDSTGGFDVVVPLAPLATAEAMLPALLPGLEHERFTFRRGSGRLVVRFFLQGLLLAAALTGVAWPRFGHLAWLGALVLPLWTVLGILTWHNLGYAVGTRFAALRHGIIGRHLAIVPMAKIQAVVLRQGPLAQLLGLADLTVYVAGGSPTRIPDLLRADAAEVVAELAAAAAAAAAAEP